MFFFHLRVPYLLHVNLQLNVVIIKILIFVLSSHILKKSLILVYTLTDETQLFTLFFLSR